MAEKDFGYKEEKHPVKEVVKAAAKDNKEEEKPKPPVLVSIKAKITATDSDGEVKDYEFNELNYVENLRLVKRYIESVSFV